MITALMINKSIKPRKRVRNKITMINKSIKPITRQDKINNDK